jgi:hypothetical protein
VTVHDVGHGVAVEDGLGLYLEEPDGAGVGDRGILLERKLCRCVALVCRSPRCATFTALGCCWRFCSRADTVQWYHQMYRWGAILGLPSS